jgi:regulator of sigma E protease
MSWILTIAGFMALIVLHELGHFLAAKAVGMRVERFSLFFGPMLVKITRGETEYGIGPIPLGGYVKITGMNPLETIPPEVAHRAYYRQPVWKRIVVISAGPAMNLLLAFAIFFAIYHWHGENPIPTTTIAAVAKGEPATGVLRPGDRVVAVDGKSGSIATLTALIASHRCAGAQVSGCRAAHPARITVLRAGRRLTFTITPRYDTTNKPPRPRVGFSFGERLTTMGVAGAANQSVSDMWRATSLTVSRFSEIFTSSKARKQIHTVVGISDEISQEFSFSTAAALYLLGLISLSLAIINLFPFLPLDGGHIFWALAEKVRGRAIPFAVMERASFVGIALVLFIVAIGFSNDIHTFTNGGFHVQ